MHRPAPYPAPRPGAPPAAPAAAPAVAPAVFGPVAGFHGFGMARACVTETAAGEAFDDIVRRSLAHMAADLTERHTLETVSEAARAGPFSLIRAFRRLTGITPMRFLTILRLAEAKRLLLTGDARVIEACYEVGYESLGSFNNRFKALVGITPTDLRRKIATLSVDADGAPAPAGGLGSGFLHAAAIYRAGAAHGDLVDLVAPDDPAPASRTTADCDIIYYALPKSGDALGLLLQQGALRSDCLPFTRARKRVPPPTALRWRAPTEFDPPVLPVIADCARAA